MIANGSWACPGFKVAQVSDSWTFLSYQPNGTSVITSADGVALVELLQGGLLFENPDNFGGLDADGNPITAVYGITTTMPNQQSPVVDVVYSGNFIFKVQRVVSNTTIVLYDSYGYADGNIDASNLFGLCSAFSPPTQLIFTGSGTIGISCLDGTSVSSGITLPHVLKAENGSVLEPMLVYASGSDVTVTIIR